MPHLSNPTIIPALNRNNLVVRTASQRLSKDSRTTLWVDSSNGLIERISDGENDSVQTLEGKKAMFSRRSACVISFGYYQGYHYGSCSLC